MSLKTPFTLYRPTRASDGQGGTALTLGTGRTVWGIAEIHANEISVCAVSRYSEIKVEDIAVIEGGNYKVMGITRNPVTGEMDLSLQKVDRPICP